MPFIENTDKYQKWKYLVTEFYILYPDGSQMDVPSNRVQSFTISHLYESNLFPIFRTEIVLAPSTYYKILKNKNNVKFKIRIQKYYTGIDNSDRSLNRDWLNDTFDLILDDDDYYADEAMLRESKYNEYDTISRNDTETDVYEVDNTVEFFLFKSSLVDKLNSVVNTIISNATINDGIQYIATSIGLNNLLMSNPHNTKTYKELVIPPLKAKQAIKFLDTYYGLYKTGMMFYCDMISNITYILEYTSKCTAYQPDEITETNILIPAKSDKYTSDMCSLYRQNSNEKYFIIGNNKSLTIRNETVSLNAYSNIDAKIVDTYSGEVSTSNSTATVKDTKTVKIIENNTENIWFSDIYNSVINAKNVVIDVTLAGYDISALSPNKTFRIVFEDTTLSSKYKKSLLLANVTHTLQREGDAFALSSIAKFRQN